VSDLFKKNAPRLSEEEERRLWQSVRSIPDQVAAESAEERARAAREAARADARRPWWRGLFATPAFRYGAPALAVLVAATLFVVQQNPRAPIPGGSGATVGTRATDSAIPQAPGAPSERNDAAPQTAPPTETLEKEQRASSDLLAQKPVDAFEDAPKARAKDAGPAGRGADEGLAASGAPAGAPSQATLREEQDPRARVGNAAESKVFAQAPTPEPTPSKVTVSREDKQEAATPAPTPARKSAPAPPPATEAAPPPAAPSPTFGGSMTGLYRTDGSGPRFMRPPGDATASSWWSLIPSGPNDAWVEVVPSLFDPEVALVFGAGPASSTSRVVLIAYSSAQGPESGEAVELAATSTGSGAAVLVPRGLARPLRAVIQQAAAGNPRVYARADEERSSFRALSDARAISFLAAEASRASTISAQSTGRARFDRLLAEATAIAARRPTDARARRLVASLTTSRAVYR
jgi:hypothetical protein